MIDHAISEQVELSVVVWHAVDLASSSASFRRSFVYFAFVSVFLCDVFVVNARGNSPGFILSRRVGECFL